MKFTLSGFYVLICADNCKHNISADSITGVMEVPSHDMSAGTDLTGDTHPVDMELTCNSSPVSATPHQVMVAPFLVQTLTILFCSLIPG